MKEKPYKVKMPLSPYFLRIIMTTLDILVCREVCNHHLNRVEPCLHDSLNNKPVCKAVPHFNLDGCLTCSHPRTQRAKGKLSLMQRESCPSPIFSRQAGATLQFDAVTAALQCLGEGLTAHLCPASWHKPWLPPLSHHKTQQCVASKARLPPSGHRQPAFLLCCSPPKYIRNPLSRPPVILYILIMFPFIHFFAGSHPWLVTLSSWEGFSHIFHHLAGLRPCEISLLVISY